LPGTHRKDNPVTVNTPALYDVLVAILATVGIAVAVAIALTVAGALYKRDEARSAKTRRPGAVAAQLPTQTDDAGELVLR
jgi:hypothetical protein